MLHLLSPFASIGTLRNARKSARQMLTISIVCIITPFAAQANVPFANVPVSSNAPDKQSNAPVYMEADRMGYDGNDAVVVAIGNVEVTQGASILLADKITYYQNKNIVQAAGNVSLLQPDGNVLFAENMRLQDDLKSGVVKNFRVRLADNSLFSAREAERVDETNIKLKKAIYSPCKVCKNEDGSPETPLWQLKASKVHIDDDEQRISYRNARMEVLGVPIAYSPYFSHPTPDADRKSGFLAPSYEQSGRLGLTVTTPYYFNIAPDKDITLTPRFTSKEGPVLGGQYRQRTDNGMFEFDGSATMPRQRDSTGVQTNGREFRGHIFAKGDSAINENWRWGFDINRVSDDTYLRRYGYADFDTLTSRIFSERFKQRDYTRIQALSFQGLRVDDNPDTTPLVAPSLETHIESKRLFGGSRARLDASALSLTRKEGNETQRLSTTVGWNLPYTTQNGHVLELDAQMRADGYKNTNRPASGPKTDSSENRIVPQLALRWRYPLIKYIDNASVTIEPNVQLITSTNGNNPQDIPNEDSQGTEFNNSNLYIANRYSGLDRVENGTRAVYGVRGRWVNQKGQNVHGSIGQQIQLDGDAAYPVARNNDDDFSDIVGSVGINYAPVSLDYRFRIDESSLDSQRNEAQASFTHKPITLHANYISIKDDPVLNDQKDVGGGINIALTDEWTVFASGQRSLQENRTVAALGGLTYQNECLTVETTMKRDFIRDRDIQPDTKFSVKVLLKNLN